MEAGWRAGVRMGGGKGRGLNEGRGGQWEKGFSFLFLDVCGRKVSGGGGQRRGEVSRW